ncbi:MAG: F1F0 ATPase subunit 2 [Psychrobacter glaciei]|jgi:F1F0 ATPase subunit 2
MTMRIANSMIYLSSVLFELLTALLSGALLGIVFFSGLWWTLVKLPTSKYPVLLFACSFAIRSSTVILGIYLMLDNSWLRLSALLLGFIAIRIIATGFIVHLQSSQPAKNNIRYAP